MKLGDIVNNDKIKVVEDFRNELFITNQEYILGVNDGKEFRKAKFTGSKMYNGKSMLTFSLLDEKLCINASYLSYALTEPKGDEHNG